MQTKKTNFSGRPSAIKSGCEILVGVCANLKQDETALVISDKTTIEVGEAIAEAAMSITNNVSHITIDTFCIHGQEPPADTAKRMSESSAVFGVTRMSMAHTKARRNASLNGAKYISLPEYTLELLCSPSLLVNFRELTSTAHKVGDLLSAGKEALVRTEAGTELFLKLDGRLANCCPGWCTGPGTLASPPDAEVNIAPLEGCSTGTVVVDGSIPCAELGMLKEPIKLEIKAGKIVSIKGKEASVLEHVMDSHKNPKTRILAELGFGLNPEARLCGVMLEDEGCLGTVHLGFGSNSTIGGDNDVGFHLDMVLRTPTVLVDGQVILKKGKLTV